MLFQYMIVTVTDGRCLDENGRDQNNRVILLYSDISKRRCLEECQWTKKEDVYYITGCEYNMATRTCHYHTKTVTRGNSNYGYTCWLFNEEG